MPLNKNRVQISRNTNKKNEKMKINLKKGLVRKDKVSGKLSPH
jgi:hypothetical protein